MRLLLMSSLCLAPILLGGCDPKATADDSATDDSADDSATDDSATDDSATDDSADDSSDDSGGGEGSALSEDAQALVTESLSDLAAALGMVLSFSHGSELGFGNPVLGTEDSIGGMASMMFACEEPVQYDPWCEPSGLEGAAGRLNGCTRFSCIEPGVWGSEAWWAARGAGDPAAPHALTLAAALGEVRWQAAPLAQWRIEGDGEGVQIEGAPSAVVEVELLSGETLDLSYSGSASAARLQSGELTRFDLSVDFHGFGEGERALAAQVALDGEGHLIGAVTRGGVAIGVVGQGEAELLVAWSEE